MAPKITLSTELPFAKGGNRACYVHPREPGKCIKILIPHKTAKEKRKRAPLYKKLRPLREFDDNLRELAAFQALRNRGIKGIEAHFPTCFGMIETDLGPGIVTELLRDQDGEVPPDFRTFVRQQGHFTEACYEAIANFQNFIRENLIVTRDLLLHNMVAIPTAKQNQLSLYLIDGLGSSDFLPLTQWSKSIAKGKIERKIKRMNGKIETVQRELEVKSTAA